MFAAKNPDEHGAFEWGETKGRQAAGKPWQSHGGVVTKALRKGKAGQRQGTEEEALTGLRTREGTVTSDPSLTSDMHRLCGRWGHGLWVISLKGQKCPPSNATLAGTQELGACECQQEGPMFRNLGLGQVRAIPAPATPPQSQGRFRMPPGHQLHDQILPLWDLALTLLELGLSFIFIKILKVVIKLHQ